MLSPYRIQPITINKRTKEASNTKFDNNSHRDHDLKSPQMTSNDRVKPDTNTESTIKRTPNKRNKSTLKAGSVHEKTEINDKYLDEILHKNTI